LVRVEEEVASGRAPRERPSRPGFDDSSSRHPRSRSEKRARCPLQISLAICADERAKPWRSATRRRRPPPHDNTTKSPSACRVSGNVGRISSLFDGNTCVNVCQGAASTGGCETDMNCAAPLTCDNDRVIGSSCTCIAGTGGTGGAEGERNVCDVGAEIPCAQPESDAVCECGRPSEGGTGGAGGAGGTGGSSGTRTIVDRCMESTMVYCDNGYACRDQGWTVNAQNFMDLYGQSKDECLATGIPCTTEEAYCPDRSFPGTYNATNHEACIDGQRNTNCAVDESDLPVFPPECDEICVE